MLKLLDGVNLLTDRPEYSIYGDRRQYAVQECSGQRNLTLSIWTVTGSRWHCSAGRYPMRKPESSRPGGVWLTYQFRWKCHRADLSFPRCLPPRRRGGRESTPPATVTAAKWMPARIMRVCSPEPCGHDRILGGCPPQFTPTAVGWAVTLHPSLRVRPNSNFHPNVYTVDLRRLL